MSIHGICFDNGQSGRCGLECELFLIGDCEGDVSEEYLLQLLDSDDLSEEKKLNMIDYYG